MASCAAFGQDRLHHQRGRRHNGELIVGELGQRGVDVSCIDARMRQPVCRHHRDETTGERIVLWDRDDRLNISAGEIDPAVIRAARLVHVDDEDQEARSPRGADRVTSVPVTSDIDRITDRWDLIAA